jgi:cysteine protease ATG4
MMLALAIQRHKLGNKWRIHKDHPDINQIQHVLRFFLDSPSPTHCPFSIHNLCLHGTPWGVAPGRWLGPLVTCKTLEAVASSYNSNTTNSENNSTGLTIITIGDMGGGAPTLYTCSILTSGAFKPKKDRCSSSSNNKIGVLILVPLVLGLGGKLNSNYIPQLQAIMSLPYSVGLVGGRPGSSSYIIGYQGDSDGNSESALALDPHIIQDAVNLEEGGGGTITTTTNMWDSYRPRVLRPVPFEDLDASLALGFYCRDEEEFEEMCVEVEKVGERWKKMPLMCVSRKERRGEGGEMAMERSLSEFMYPENEGGEEKGVWELL